MSTVTLGKETLRFTRGLHVSASLFAKKPAVKQGGKTKAKQGFKPKKEAATETKAKKGGMTHLNFRDAVRQLGFEKNARELSVPELSIESLESQNGKIVKYAAQTESKLNLLGSFKRYQHHELFRNPILIISPNLLKLNQTFLSKFDQETTNNRIILLGEYRMGKSTLISQIQALANDKYNGNAVLLHFDHPEKITDGSSDYFFNKKLGLYQQPMFTKRWIQKIREANKSVFEQMKLTKDVSFVTKKVEFNYKAGEQTLYEYLTNCHDFGKVESTNAFEFFVSELVHYSKEFPVLLSVDNFNAFTSHPLSEYRHADFSRIHVREFEMGNFILNFVNGSQKFAKGGVLLSESADFGKHDNLAIGLGFKEYDPYAYRKVDTQLIEELLSNGGVKPFVVEYLPKEYVKSLCGFYYSQGVLFVRDYVYKEDEREEVYGLEQVVDLHFTRSGGNPGLLLKHVAMSY